MKKVFVIFLMSFCVFCSFIHANSSELNKVNVLAWLGFSDSCSKKIESLEKKFDDFEKKQSDANTEIAIQNKEEISALKNEIKITQNKILKKIQEIQERLDESKEVEQILIKYGNNPDGISTLHYAIKKGDINAVSLLIANGADVNSKDNQFTTLCRSAMHNNLEITELLLAFGANPNIDFDHPSYHYPIYYAVKSSSGDLVEALIKGGSRIDRTNSGSATALHIACEVGNYEATVVLINNGADINATQVPPNQGCNDWRSGTPLDWAAFNLKYEKNPLNLDLVKLLVQNGATRRWRSFNEQNFICPVILGYLKSVGR